jgi:ABC-type uncharacterized transport system involved in gliding motility auxiliary subunit
MLQGTARQAHSEERRKRTETNLKGEYRFKTARKREADFTERALAPEDERMKKQKVVDVPAGESVDEDMRQPTPGESGSGAIPVVVPA